MAGQPLTLATSAVIEERIFCEGESTVREHTPIAPRTELAAHPDFTRCTSHLAVDADQ